MNFRCSLLGTLALGLCLSTPVLAQFTRGPEPLTPNSYGVTVTSTQTTYTAGATNTFNYAVTIVTDGTIEFADNIRIVFPAGVTLVSASGPSPFNFCGGGQGNFTNPTALSAQWSTPGNPSGCGAFASGTFNFVAMVAVPVGFTGNLTTNVFTDGDGFGPGAPAASNNPIVFGPTGADLSAVLIDSPDPVDAGSNLTYTASVLNTGPASAADVSLVLTLPPGTTLVLSLIHI